MTTEKGEGHDVMWSHVFFRRDTGEWESPQDMPSQNNPMLLKNTFEWKSKKNVETWAISKLLQS